MLTSIKDALNNERYYDAVSNNINSTITMYSDINELQKESKVFIEDAYKPLKCNVDVMSKTATESLDLLEKISNKVLPSFDKIDDMKSSFSTEGAFTNFLELVYEDAYNYVEELTIKIIDLHKSIISICSKLEKFIMNVYGKNEFCIDLAEQLVKRIESMSIKDIPISEFITKGNPDITVDFIQVNNVEKITTDKFSEYLSFIQIYINKNAEKPYLYRLKEKCNILNTISLNINKCCKNLISGINRYSIDEGKTIKKAIESLLKNNKNADIFFKFMDINDINLWVRHEYSFIPSYDSNTGNNEFKVIFADRIKEIKALDDIYYSQNKIEIDKCKSKDAITNKIISLASPLTVNDITKKIESISLSEKKPFNVKDLFGYLTVNEVIEKLKDTISNFETFKSNVKPDVLDSIQKEIVKACKTNMDALRIYQSSLKDNLNFRDNSNNNLNRSLCTCLMRLFSDINTSIVAINQLIVNDVIKKCVCVINTNEAINNLLKYIKTILDNESN